MGKKRTNLIQPLTLQAKNVVSVKGGCIEGLDWSKAIHLWTKSAMVPIPEGSETHSEDPSPDEFGGYSSSYMSSQDELDQPGPLVGTGGCELPSHMKD